MYQLIQNTLQQLLNDENSFYAFRQPGEETLYIAIIKKVEPFNYSVLDKEVKEPGFIMFPFSQTDENGWIFSAENTIALDAPNQQNARPSKYQIQVNEEPDEACNYVGQFKKMMEALNNGEVQKVILSRTIKITEPLQKDIYRIFTDLLKLHPKAFTYLVVSKETGIWMGASPELLISRQDGICTTVSLAGTRPHDANDESWTHKEKEEQGLVSNYIDNLLKNYKITEYKKEGPSIIKAGNLTHLKTLYTFKNKTSLRLAHFVQALHPTPALCGEPKEKAMHLIKKVETHKRSYYSGFLGPISKNALNLYVNIRCMKINPSYSTIYVGGGLTRQSDLESEWNETILKSKTLLSVISTQ